MKKILVIVLAVALLAMAGGVVAAKTINNDGPALNASQQTAPKLVLGVVVADLNSRLATRLGLGNATGVVILRVQPGSAAATAGLQAKDIVTAVNGAAVTTAAQFRTALQAASDKVTLTILRGKDTLTVTANPQPAPQWQIAGPKWLPEIGGINVGDLFGHFLGGQWGFLDKDGNKHTITTTPGVVQSVNDSSITIVPNGQTSPVTFTVSDKTVVRVKGGKVTSLTAGNKVVITTVDNSQEARVVSGGAAGLAGPGPQFGMRPHGMFGLGARAHGFRGPMSRYHNGGATPRTGPSQSPAPSPSQSPGPSGTGMNAL